MEVIKRKGGVKRKMEITNPAAKKMLKGEEDQER